MLAKHNNLFLDKVLGIKVSGHSLKLEKVLACEKESFLRDRTRFLFRVSYLCSCCRLELAKIIKPASIGN